MTDLAIKNLALARGRLQLNVAGDLEEISRLERDIQVSRERIAENDAKIAAYSDAIQQLGGEIPAQEEETVG
jgi:hypothetical protein